MHCENREKIEAMSAVCGHGKSTDGKSASCMSGNVGLAIKSVSGRLKEFALLSAAVLGLFCSSCTSCVNSGSKQVEEVVEEESWPLGFCTDTLSVDTLSVRSGETMSHLFTGLGLSDNQSHELVQSADSVFSAKMLRSGKRCFAYSADTLGVRYLVYEKDNVNSVVFRCFPPYGAWNVAKEIKTTVEYADVTINSSLWVDMRDAGVSPLLIISLSDIYAWTVDFFGLQKGDRFRVVYDLQSVEGEAVAVDTVRTAQYIRGNDTLRCYMFNQGDGGNVYWNEKGESMRKTFLKAPLHFSRISSGFSYARKHPVTRKVQPHTGVDYAAPAGTPVVSIGDGTVISAKYEGAGGNTVRIRHNSVYTTAYLHLSRYASGIKSGSRVRQGQVIGYVGSTGRSTGPHLDFRVWKNGSAINPLKMQSPPAEPLPESAMESFCENKLRLDSMLDSLSAQRLAMDGRSSADRLSVSRCL